jgi:thiol-disulfide isomerase/thioredoxin
MENNFEKTKQLVLSLPLQKGITLREVENILPDRVEQHIKVDCRVSKKNKMQIFEYREALYDLLSEEMGCRYATEYINNNFTILVGLQEGDLFKPIEVHSLENEKIELTHERGKIWLVDFWATWCQYCQEPMEENVKMSSKLHSDAKIIGLSCDEDRTKWREYINKRGWGKISQYVKPDLLKYLGLKTIPDMVILDKEGRIVYLGHPNHIKIEATLNNLADGKGCIVHLDNSNTTWKENDLATKRQIVSDIAESLNKAGINKVAFYVNTKTAHTLNGTNSKTTIIFKGEVTPNENEMIRKLDLGGLKEPVYNLTVLNLFDEDF